MSVPIANKVLDEILTLQFLIGWAGEGRSEPPRLGWWATDLVDEFGGGDFLQRLLPKTHKWAALEAVREAAKRRAEAARKQSANSDKVRSLFYFGYEIDHQLDERLRELKSFEKSPVEVLPALSMVDDEFDAEHFGGWLGALVEKAKLSTRQTPGGRLLTGASPEALVDRARYLAAAHAPFDSAYPQPYFEV